ncbi:proteasome assembly chaperone 1-like [Littorina saxatilis]|uniref:Proteasome assembly chaperone 1 n=1 Tax=Littorina saxatilis TaxID=31220 RepID=A0AAN9BJQ4_9CAEN
MATFFGEVLPVISRAVDDEEDEDEIISERCDSFIHWSSRIQGALLHIPNKKLECNILIVAIGPAAVGFTDTCIKHGDYYLVANIFSGLKDDDRQTLTQNAPTDKTCYLYRSNEDASTFICLCNMDVAVEQCYAWVNELFSGLDTDDADVVVLNTSPTSRFTCEVPTSDMPCPFLRGLKTNKFSGVPFCPVLEQPNLVTGLAAQILTYCQAYSMKALLYQCYTKARKLVDLETMKAFTPCLESTPIRDIIRKNPEADKQLRDIAQKHEVQDTLYL